jgi:Family of unknown function (DUF5684)/FHA domain
MGSGDSAISLIYLVMVAVGYVWVSLALAAVFGKVGVAKAQAWIPVWNLAVLLRLGGFSPWLILIPVVDVVLVLIACHRIGLAFGYGPAMTVVAALWFPIWASVLGWGNAIWSGVVKTPSRIWADEPTPLPRVTFADEPTDPIQPAAVPSMMAEDHLQWGLTPPQLADAAAAASPSIDDPDPAVEAKEGDDMTDPDREQTPEPSRWTPVPRESAPITAVDLVAAAFDRPFDDDLGIKRARPSQETAVPSPASAQPAEPTPQPELAAKPETLAAQPAAAPEPQPRPPARSAPPSRRVGMSLVEETTELDQTMLASRFRQNWAIVGRDGNAVELTGNIVVAGRKPGTMRAHPDAQLLIVPDTSRTVSKAHALLRLVRGVWMVRDLGSTNGVILVGADGTERLLAPDQEEPLTERFFLGDAEFTLVSND